METNTTSEPTISIDPIPTQTAKLISVEVKNDLAGIEKTTIEGLKDDGIVDKGAVKEIVEDTRIFYEEVMREQREGEYLFLRWYKETNDPQKVLYMGSGHDVMPKHVFSEEKVVHLSMENYLTVNEKTGKKDTKYFPELGSGFKVVGNAAESPFEQESYNTVFLQDTSYDYIDGLCEETERLLKSGGRVILSKNNFTSDSFGGYSEFFENSEQFDQELVPSEL